MVTHADLTETSAGQVKVMDNTMVKDIYLREKLKAERDRRLLDEALEARNEELENEQRKEKEKQAKAKALMDETTYDRAVEVVSYKAAVQKTVRVMKSVQSQLQVSHELALLAYG